MSNRNEMLVVDRKELKRLMSEKKSFAGRNEKKVESRFAKYPFGSMVSVNTTSIIDLFASFQQWGRNVLESNV